MGSTGIVWTAKERKALGLDRYKHCGTNTGWRLHRSWREPPCWRCRRARQRTVDNGHGTYAGWMIHRREGTEPCGPCLFAGSERHRINNRRREGRMTPYEKQVDHAAGELRTAGTPYDEAWEQAVLQAADPESEHAAHCGPARGFKICYCRCPACRDPETRRCTCPGCRANH